MQILNARILRRILHEFMNLHFEVGPVGLFKCQTTCQTFKFSYDFQRGFHSNLLAVCTNYVPRYSFLGFDSQLLKESRRGILCKIKLRFWKYHANMVLSKLED